MNRRRFFLLALFAVYAGLCAAAPEAPAPAGFSAVIFVRHAEKSEPNGDVPLSAAGRERAETLAAMLERAGITHILTSEMIRTAQTAEPLAHKLGLTSKALPVAKSELLAAELLSLPAGSLPLVVSHSNSIPKVLEKLGANPIASPIEEEQYDRMFIVVRAADGGLRTLELRYGAPSSPAAKQHP
jgi:phosphohistidine phosphatase SixA